MLLPHSVTVYVCSEPKNSLDVAQAMTFESTGTVMLCQITPKSPQWGLTNSGIELNKPHHLITKLDYLEFFEFGYLVVKGSRNFVVKGIRAHDFGNAADHLSITLEELDFK